MLFDLPPRTKELRERVRTIAGRDIAPHAAETERTEQYPWACVEALRRGRLKREGRELQSAITETTSASVDELLMTKLRLAKQIEDIVVKERKRLQSPKPRAGAAAAVKSGPDPRICESLLQSLAA